MHKKKAAVAVAATILSFYLTISSASAATLSEGMQGTQISTLQSDLKNLGFFSVNPTGYYGQITQGAVERFQARYGLTQDGIAGNNTLGMIDRLLGRQQTNTSRGESSANYLMPWFGGVESFFSRGETATVYDIDSGLSFRIMRTYGYNHADCEALSAADTAIMKKIYGGQWSWARRAVIVTVNGRKIAASMAGMPHAGVDSAPADEYVQWRSEGYGPGTNLDTVKGNNMDGHFDIHFSGSRTHGTNQVDAAHQAMVQKAAEWAKAHY